MTPNIQGNSLQTKLEKIDLDLAAYKIMLHFHGRKHPSVVHFDKPARRFYFSVITLIAIEMKNLGKPEFIHIRKHEKTLKLLDTSLAGQNASKTVKGMWDKVRKAWRYTLPDLETGALFKVMDRSQVSPSEKGGKFRYDCSDEECDVWANLFGYDESNPWRFKFAIDSVSLQLHDLSVTLGDRKGNSAWQEFINGLNSTPKSILKKRWALPKGWKKWFFSLVTISIVTATSLIWIFNVRHVPPSPVTNVSGKPTIAVLSFDNLSDDPEQEYFSDGFTDDLITDLSKISNLFVISRNSSFTYKGNPVKVQQIAKELGVRYVLEGSTRKVGTQVRINVQLIDAITGHHLWAKRFDNDLSSIFTLQEGIIKEILTALGVQLTLGEQIRIFARNTDSIEAYQLFLQAAYQQRKTHQEGNDLARKLSKEAIDLDPNFADPYRLLAWTHLWDVWFGWSKSPGESFKEAARLAEQSLALDDTNPGTVALMGHMSLLKRQHDKAIAEGERSIALDPNSANNYMLLAATLRFAGRAEEGIPLLKKAIRLEPYPPANFYYQLGMAYNFTGNYDEAIAVLKKALIRTPNHLLSLIGLTVAYSLADHMEEARATAEELLLVNPSFSVANLEKKAPYKNKVDLDLSIGAMRKAGLK